MLTLFGRPQLTTQSGERIEVLPTGWRLLAVLAAGPAEGVSRAELAGLVVPSGKLSTLRKLVWDVRQSLARVNLSVIDGDASRLRLSADVICDVRELRTAKQGRALRDIYRGPFFDATLVFDHAPWSAWLAEQREALHKYYVERASEGLASTDCDWPTKVLEAKHLLQQAPDHAEATRILMLQAARMGDGREIRFRYSDLSHRLSRHGAQPDRSTTNFMHRLLGDTQRQLGTERSTDVMKLPTVYVSRPSASENASSVRLMQSLLTDITIGLCRASVFRVIASQSSGAWPEVGGCSGSDDAGAYYVVASSIIDHVCGEQIVFTLLSWPRREVLWTERVESAPDYTVAAYNLLTAGILRSLVRRIKDVEIEAFRLDAGPSAYASYLAGYSSLNSLDLAELRKGRHHLRRSMSQSPNFAPTTSALARSYQLEWLVMGRGEHKLLGMAREHSLHAIASDSLEARGFKALGFCDLYDKRFDAALEHYARAEQLNRNYAELIAEHANCLLHCGFLALADEKIEYAMQINPEYGDMYRWTKACVCFLQERYDDVLQIIDQMRDRDPALRLQAATHALMGNQGEAERSRMEALKTYPGMTIEGWIDTVALKDPQHIQHYSTGLAEAGFH